MASEPPVLPDGEEGRRWAAEELSKPGYQRPAPAWLEDRGRWVLDWLGQIDSPSGPPSSVAGPLIAVAAAVMIVVAIVLVKPRLNARRKAKKQMYDAGTSVTADAYRRRAEAAAAAGDLSAAVVDRYRALVRAAEELEVIDVQAGRTAAEAATQLGRAYPGHALRLAAAAGNFNAVLYGHSGADRNEYAAMTALDEALQADSEVPISADISALQEMQVPR